MAFTEADRVQIRKFLGFSAVFVQADPRLENAISSAQSTADGGVRPDNSTELLIKAIITDLQTVETRLKALWPVAIALQADDAKVDAARAMAVLRMEGWRYVGQLSDAVNTKPLRNVFQGPSMSVGIHDASRHSDYI